MAGLDLVAPARRHLAAGYSDMGASLQYEMADVSITLNAHSDVLRGLLEQSRRNREDVELILQETSSMQRTRQAEAERAAQIEATHARPREADDSRTPRPAKQLPTVATDLLDTFTYGVAIAFDNF